MKFIYKAKGGIHKEIEGTIEAASKQEALNALWEKGLFPFDVVSQEDPSVSGRPLPAKKKFFSGYFHKRITTHHLLIFTQQLATIVRAKVELLTALKIVYEYTDHPVFKENVFTLCSDIKDGKKFSDSLQGFPSIFSVFYVNMVKTGEASGQLDAALDQISGFIKRKEGLRKKVIAALAYPSILLMVGCGSIFVLINFVIPRIKFMLEGLEDGLPLITRIVFSISDFSNKIWWLIGGIGLVSFSILYFQRGSPFFRELLRKLKMATPVVKGIVKNQELAYFSNSMGTLLKNGVSALEALKVTIPGVQDPKLRRELGDVLGKVSDGKSLYESFNGVASLPGFFIRMVAVGEESGKLTEIFEELSHSYTEQVESDISILSALLEPILILFLGVIMGAIVISILVPMFQITQLVE